MEYFLRINGQVIGPMSAEQVFAYEVNPNIAVSVDGMNWQPLYTLPELMQIFHSQNQSRQQPYGQQPYGQQPYGQPYGPQYSQQSDSKRVLCGIMALLFGTLGIQYFICGKVGGGFITILLSLITCGAWSIIVFIQGIMMLCMSDAEFQRKYVDSTSTFPLF